MIIQPPNTQKIGITKTPYFRVWIGLLPEDIDSASGNLVGFGTDWDDNEFNSHIEEVTVTDEWSQPSGFTLKIVDAEMKYLFDKIFIGQKITIDIGYSDNAVRKIGGYILKGDYSFTEDARPTLTISGNALEWDRLNKDLITWRVSIKKAAPTTGLVSAFIKTKRNAKDGHGTWNTFTEFMTELAKSYNLQIVPGSTVPYDIDEVIAPGGKADLSSAGKMTAWGFLDSLAKRYGCVFITKDPYLYFYPISFIEKLVFEQASVNQQLSTAIEKKASAAGNIDEQLKLQAQIEKLQGDIGGKGKLTVGWTTKTDAPSFWYRMDNPSKPGMGYNLLNFKPRLQDINFRAILGVSVDPETGDVAYRQTVTSEEQDKAAIQSGTPLGAGTVTGPGKKKSGDPARNVSDVPSPASVWKYENDLNTGKMTAVEEKIDGIPPGIARDANQLKGIINGNFRENMWFAEASAVVVGDPTLSAGTPCYIMGIGSPRQLSKSEHEPKLCGKWYIKSVNHTVKARSPYTCKLELQRFLQPLSNVKESDAAKIGKGIVPQYKSVVVGGTVKVELAK